MIMVAIRGGVHILFISIFKVCKSELATNGNISGLTKYIELDIDNENKAALSQIQGSIYVGTSYMIFG